MKACAHVWIRIHYSAQAHTLTNTLSPAMHCLHATVLPVSLCPSCFLDLAGELQGQASYFQDVDIQVG